MKYTIDLYKLKHFKFLLIKTQGVIIFSTKNVVIIIRLTVQ